VLGLTSYKLQFLVTEELNAFNELAGHGSWNKTERNSGQNCQKGDCLDFLGL
jgi:hypothetical protein